MIGDRRSRALVIAEVEMERAGAVVAPPAWLAPYVEREVSTEPGWTDRELAR